MITFVVFRHTSKSILVKAPSNVDFASNHSALAVVWQIMNVLIWQKSHSNVQHVKRHLVISATARNTARYAKINKSSHKLLTNV